MVFGYPCYFPREMSHHGRSVRLQTYPSYGPYISPHLKKRNKKIAHLQFLLYCSFFPSVFHSRFPRRRTPCLFRRKWRTCISSSLRCLGFVWSCYTATLRRLRETPLQPLPILDSLKILCLLPQPEPAQYSQHFPIVYIDIKNLSSVCKNTLLNFLIKT